MMIEKTILDYLNQEITACMEMPEEYAPPFALLEKTGGGEEHEVSRSTFAIQSYGRTMYEAAELNERVKALMKNLIELDEISKVSLNSDYNFTNTATKRYRYQAVFDIVHY